MDAKVLVTGRRDGRQGISHGSEGWTPRYKSWVGGMDTKV